MSNFEIDARLYESIVEWCNVNGVKPIKYIEKALRERLATDKYGDLNERFQSVSVISENNEEKNDDGRNVPEIGEISPKAKNEAETTQHNEVVIQVDNQSGEKEETLVNDSATVEEQQTVRKTKRTLKTK